MIDSNEWFGLGSRKVVPNIRHFPVSFDLVPEEFAKTVAPQEYAAWLLTNFARVDEVRRGLPEVIIGNVVFPYWGITPPCRYVIHDADGKRIVIEVIKGKMNVHDNPLGVLTNSPTFNWHVTNLRNYINLTPPKK
jgi:choloylglycine hydrolase